jgi:hypothetical protein
MTFLPRRLFAAFSLAVLCLGRPAAAEGANPLQTLRAVGPEGRGNEAAAAAVRALSAAGPEALPEILRSMDGANDYALNWIRSAVEVIQARASAGGKPVPVGELEAFLKDTSHHPRARRLAYELILKQDAVRARLMLPGFLNDPGDEMRRDAVEQIVEAGNGKAAGDKAGAIGEWRRALAAAREAGQIEAIAAKLKEAGASVDLPGVFGWVTKWKLLAPFDNTGSAAFEKVYEPEKAIDLAGEVEAKPGKVRWRDFEAKDDYGTVDFNAPYTPLKSVAGYAYAEFWCDKPQDVEVRLGSQNAWKAWVNGAFIFGHDEYHRNKEIDQFRMPVAFKAGRNTLLVKCLQNDLTEDWAKEWQFQLRITDAQGTPIRFPAPPADKN